MGYFNSGFNLITHAFRGFTYCIAPESKNAKAALSHIGILRFIQSGSLGLAIIKYWKAIWVSVPVVAVKLNHNGTIWYVSINDKLVEERNLLIICNSYLIKDSIPGKFKFIRRKRLLKNVHREQAFLKSGVVVAALNRTVCWIGLFCAGLRKTIFLPTNFTAKLKLIASLPLILTFPRTKPCFVFTASNNIEFISTLFAYVVSASLSILSLRCLTAQWRAESMLVICWLKLRTAPLTIAERKPRRYSLTFARTKMSAIFRSSRFAIEPLKRIAADFACSNNCRHGYIIQHYKRFAKETVIT